MTEDSSSFELESDDSFHIGEIKSIATSLKASVVKPELPEEDEPEIESDDTVNLEEGGSEKPQTVVEVESRQEKEKPSLRKIPILDRETANPNTFDLEYLLDPQKQKKARERQGGRGSKTPDRLFRPEQLYHSTTGTTPDTQHAEHLLSYKHVYEAKKRSREAAFEAAQMKDCTFQPKTSSPSRRPRSPIEFLQDMTRYESKRQERISQLKERLDEENSAEKFSYRPVISSSSRRLATSRSQEEVFTRLSSVKLKEITRPIHSPDQLSSDETPPAKPNFTPEINKKSRKVNREGEITERLMEDARRRAANSQSPIDTQRSVSPGIAPKSMDILVTRFKTEMNTYLGDSKTVTYSRFKEILLGIRLVCSTDATSMDLCAKLWTKIALSGDEVSDETLRSTLLGVMDYDAANSKLHREFYHLYCTRTGRYGHKASVSPTPSTSSKPVNSASSTKYINELIASQEKVRQKVDKLRENYLEKEMQKCPFVPSVNPKIPKTSRSPVRTSANSTSISSEYKRIIEAHSSRSKALHSLANIQREKRALSSVPQAEDTSECTFTPAIAERLQAKQVRPVKGVAEAVRRLKQARANEEWKTVMQSKGRPQCKSLERERREWTSQRVQSSVPNED